MTSLELLKACSIGSFPTVSHNGNIGRVTTIKDNGKFKGCGVTFPDIPYEVWFLDLDESDKRRKYMRDLILK
jgi:hypothetical protein